MSGDEPRRVWVSQYALTRGILSGLSESNLNGRVALVVLDGEKIGAYFRKPNWHLSLGEAVEAAKKRQRNKLGQILDRAIQVNGLVFPDNEPAKVDCSDLTDDERRIVRLDEEIAVQERLAARLTRQLQDAKAELSDLRSLRAVCEGTGR